MSQLSQAGLPSSFDPFKTHPFTNINRAPQPRPAPSPYARPVPTYQGYDKTAPPPMLSAPSSLPTAQTPVHSPQPQRASPHRQTSPTQGPARHVFESFRLERASPELEDVLAKKGANSPARRSSGTSATGMNANDAKQAVKKTK